jgi:hypothetical protein
MRYAQTIGAGLLAILFAVGPSWADQGHSNSGNSNVTATESTVTGSSPNQDTADVLKIGSPSFKRACLDAKNNPDRHQSIIGQCKAHGY